MKWFYALPEEEQKRLEKTAYLPVYDSMVAEGGRSRENEQRAIEAGREAMRLAHYYGGASMLYIVTDRNNKDREDYIVGTFTTRKEAEDFVAEWETQGETYLIEEWSSVDDARGEESD